MSMIPHAPYDPFKAHAYYLRTRKLKGRAAGLGLMKKSSVAKAPAAVLKKPIKQSHNLAQKRAAKAAIARLTLKLHTLENALKEAQVALHNKKLRAQKNSDGKTTVQERQAAKQYRTTHKAKIAAAEKKASKTTPSAPKSVSGMNEKELTDRISKIKGLISNVHDQIKAANVVLHS